MTEQPPQIFLDSTNVTVLSIKHGERFMINTTQEPPQAANDELPPTHLEALLEVQRMKKGITHKQSEDLPFTKRQQLHDLWKGLSRFEQKMIDIIFK